MTDTTHIEAVARALFDVEYSSISNASYDEECLNENKKSYWECAANAAIYELQKCGWKSPDEAAQIRRDALEEAANAVELADWFRHGESACTWEDQQTQIQYSSSAVRDLCYRHTLKGE
jgi:hypothetical protein